MVPSRSRIARASIRVWGSVDERGSVACSRLRPRKTCFEWVVYSTPPPTTYAGAPGTDSSAAEISPPAEPSATATVSPRSLRRAPTRAARSASSAENAMVTSPSLAAPQLPLEHLAGRALGQRRDQLDTPRDLVLRDL